MNGRSPARLLAPLALVLAAIALFAVVSSGSDSGSSDADTSRPAATATPASTSAPKREREDRVKTYTVQPGDTPSSIAAAEDIDLDELLEANPDMDPNALTVGEEVTIP